MKKEQAIKIISELIRQSMAAGMFKNFQDLDTARQALAALSNFTKEDGAEQQQQRHQPGKN